MNKVAKRKNILVVGSLNMDLTVSLKRIPQVGETVLGDSICYTGGGKGANQACACAKLGGEITMLGSVGADDNGAKLIENLQNCKAAVSSLQQLTTDPTGTALIYVDEAGSNNIVVVPGANSATSITYLQEQDALFDWCDYMLIQMEIPLDSVLYAVKRAQEKGATVVLNPAPAPDASSLVTDILRYVDIITPNETELQILTGWEGKFSMDQLKLHANKLLEQGPTSVVVTLGGMGAALCEKDKDPILLSPPEATVVDTVAAGDCFNGAMVVALSEGECMVEAIKFANHASTIAVSRKGAQDSIPYRQEVNQFMEKCNTL